MAASDSKRGWRFQDLTGQRFGRLTPISLAPGRGDGQTYWNCRCDCGGETVVAAGWMKGGNTRSCGCLRREKGFQKGVGQQTTHGLTIGGMPVWFQRWNAMMTRCYSPKAKNYSRYGGRGIFVCARWHDPAAFLADMGVPPQGMSIDRIDNDGPYSPENCKWSSTRQQARNKSTSRLLTHDGVTLTMREWAERTGISYSTLHQRLKTWSVERALTNPVKHRPANGA